MNKLIRNIIFILLLVLATWWAWSSMDILPSLRNVFRSKEVVIDQTPIVVSEIRSLSQLVTVTAYDEIIADTMAPTNTRERISQVLNPFRLEKVLTTKRLILIGKVTTHVGIDMQQLTENDIRIHNDSIHIDLPTPVILDIILNPSGTEVFLEEGSWDQASVSNLKKTMMQKAGQGIKDKNLYEQSKQKSIEVLTDFLKATGYTSISIGFKEKKLG
jgi:hypothetical protein